MKKITIIMLIVLSVIGISYAQKSTGTVTSTDSVEVDISTDVPVYEYKPKVIIQGKWGKGPGEFGSIMQGYIGESETVYKPSSLTVDSKGNIYILDVANNRIQKFDKDGKYLLSIPVESIAGEVIGYCVDGKDGFCTDIEKPSPDTKYDWPILGKVYIQGINIVIDSNDTLYYYLKRTKDGKETGEVWEFRDDKLVKKWEVPVTGNLYYEGPLGIYLAEDDSIWISDIKENGEKTNNYYEIKDRKRYTPNEREEKLARARENQDKQKNKKYKVDIREEKEKSVFKISDSKGRMLSNIVINPSEIFNKAKAKYGLAHLKTYFLGEKPNGNIAIKVIEGSGDISKVEEREYDSHGKLVKVINLSDMGAALETDENGIKVRKWTLERVR